MANRKIAYTLGRGRAFIFDQIPENIFHPWKIGGKFLKIFFTHEETGGKFLKIFFTHAKLGANSWKYFAPMKIMGPNSWKYSSKHIFPKNPDTACHYDTAWHAKIWHDTQKYGLAWHVKPWHGMARGHPEISSYQLGNELTQSKPKSTSFTHELLLQGMMPFVGKVDIMLRENTRVAKPGE